MQEKLEEIDTQAIDELARINEERDRIHGFRQRAEEKKEDVEEDIYRRVIEDYEEREQALDEEAAPLRRQGREEYRKLASILESVHGELGDARARQQELEFRHDVGEIDGDELEERLEEPEAVIGRCEGALEELDELRNRFVEAFGSEEALETVEEEPEPTGEKPEPTEEEPAATEEEPEVDGGAEEAAVPAATDAEEPEATRVAVEALEEEEQEEGQAPEGPSPDATVVADPSMLESDEEEGAGEDAEETMVVPNARLLLRDENGEESEEFFLGPVNYIGRAPDNHVCVEAPAVSRKHALISAGPDGFVIQDLDSPNGTFVNGEEVEDEHQLEDGDEIKLGNVELSFHSP